MTVVKVGFDIFFNYSLTVIICYLEVCTQDSYIIFIHSKLLMNFLTNNQRTGIVWKNINRHFLTLSKGLTFNQKYESQF